MPRDTASSSTPRVSAPGVIVWRWKGRNPLLEQLCPPGGCCRAVPISVPTSAGKEAVETPSTVAMTAPSAALPTVPARYSHLPWDSPPAGAQAAGSLSPERFREAEKRRVGYPMFPFPAGRVAPSALCILPGPGSTAGPRCRGDNLHGDRAGTAASRGPRQGRPWGCVPPPHGAFSPQGSVKMEIPQVASGGIPRKLIGFPPSPSLVLVGFHSTLVIAALHLLKGRLMLCTGLIGN